MGLIEAVLRRPYTVIALVILVCILGVGSALRMPTDIFPEINIPVVAVVWTYNGMSADEIQNRIVALHERQLASLVDDIDRIECNCYTGVGVIRVYLHEGADVSRAVSQLGSSALVVLKYMPRNITPPLVLRYGATDVPIIQLSISSRSQTDTRLNDLGQNIIRPDLAEVHGASVPYPYGGKPRVIMVDLDQQALAARGLSPADVSQALQHQNVILPSGDVKLGTADYQVLMNNSPHLINAINRFPIGESSGKMVFIGDVAHVHDGYQVQTNSVSVDGRPGGLMMVRKTGGVSTLAVVNGVRETVPKLMPDLLKVVPDLNIKPIFDQSIFVKAAIDSVLMGGTIAAGLTGLMILLFLGNWRLTLIIMVSIPLSIVAALMGLYGLGQTLNTMTLGGFALAAGILVDDATVVIENIERHVGMGKGAHEAVVDGTAEILLPTFLSTLSICIVFIPVFLLTGTPHYLFSPLSLSVVLAMLCSLILSRTLVPVMFKYLMRSYIEKHLHLQWQHQVRDHVQNRSSSGNPFAAIHYGFESGFNAFRNAYRNAISWAVAHCGWTAVGFVAIGTVSLGLYPLLGQDFFPQVDAGQMRLHVRAPPGTRLEQTQADFSRVEATIRQIVGNNQIDVVLDNIGLPYSGINIALGDSATVGPMDGEILISLKEKHTSTWQHVADLRRELPRRFPEMRFFFQPADIVNQVLNFGAPAPIDIRVSGVDSTATYALANKLVADLKKIPGVVDTHIFQVPDAPSLNVDVDRTFAQNLHLKQDVAADSLLMSLNSSGQVAPNFWLSQRNGVSYPLVVQTPTYKISSMQDLRTMPLNTPTGQGQLLMNIARFSRGTFPMVVSQLNIRPVFDVNADVQGCDLQSAAEAIQKVIAADKPDELRTGISVSLAGQVKTMQESYQGLFTGMGLAVVLVFLLMVINFQSWLDPLIVLLAVPFALAGVMWMLFLTQTHLSVPALMGTLMCIGLTTANSILVVSFANQRMAEGESALNAAVAAGYTRLRPVLMTAGAMILGMVPMSLGIGEGGEQNAPLGRAVIGGLIFATFATLVFVPAMYRIMRDGKHRGALQEKC